MVAMSGHSGARKKARPGAKPSLVSKNPTDPTRSSKKQIEIAEAEQLLALSSGFLWESDEHHQISWLSTQFTDVTGIAASEMLGRSRIDFLSQIEQDWAQAHLLDLADYRPFRDFRHAMRTQSGDRIQLALSGLPRFDGDRNFLGYRGAAQVLQSGVASQPEAAIANSPAMSDLDQLIDNEALHWAIRENELYRNIIDHLPVSIFAKNKDLQLIYVNQGWSDLTGMDRFDAIGRTDQEIFGSETGHEFTHSDQKLLEKGGVVEAEERFVQEDGAIRYLRARKSVMKTRDERTYLIGTTIDITDLRQRTEELRLAEIKAVSADRLKTQFLANMSHEIRTPMNGVLGMAELLAKSNLTPRQQTFTDIIVRSANELLTTINDVLDFSMIDMGHLVLETGVFAPADVVDNVTRMLSGPALEREIELIVRIDPKLPINFIGDSGRIRQVLMNLVSNAVKFSEGGHIFIEVSCLSQSDTGMGLRFSVSDMGVGIAAENLELIFEKFAKADVVEGRRQEGTGLGLAICAKLISLMGGTMGVESILHEGSNFWFDIILPIDQPVKPPRISHDLKGARVLIIDDNELCRAVLTELLTEWGRDSCAAISGEEGMAVLKSASTHGLTVDCVLIDHHMPGMNGVDVARAIRGDTMSEAVPIILLSPVAGLNSLAALEAAIDAQIFKPAPASLMMETLAATICQHRSYKIFAEDDETERAQLSASPIPVAAEINLPGKPAEAPRHRPDLSDERPEQLDVLVAEDNAANQIVLSQILQSAGLSFKIVDNGRDVLKAFKLRRPHLIVMDVSLPDLSGLETAVAIRTLEQDGSKRVPIIGLTTHALNGDPERCLAAGMDDYLAKPIGPNALLKKIAIWRPNQMQPFRKGTA